MIASGQVSKARQGLNGLVDSCTQLHSARMILCSYPDGARAMWSKNESQMALKRDKSTDLFKCRDFDDTVVVCIRVDHFGPGAKYLGGVEVFTSRLGRFKAAKK